MTAPHTTTSDGGDIPDVIDRFSGRWRFLSNFAPCVVRYDDVDYPSVEHAYQAAKTLNPLERMAIRLERSPSYAKRIGRRLHLRDDWNSYRHAVMYALLQQKFAEGTIYRPALMRTGNAILVEGNDWGDEYWGVDARTGVGENYLGKLLMQIRQEIWVERNR